MISFSANVKRELCRTAPGAKCCALAEMLGALLYANHFSASCIRIVTENPEFAARLPRLLQRGFGLRFDALPEPEAQVSACSCWRTRKKSRMFSRSAAFPPNRALHCM